MSRVLGLFHLSTLAPGWYQGGAMKTLRDVAKELELSVDAVRKRVRLLEGALDGEVQRGPRGVLLLSDEAVELIRRLEEVRRQDGITLEQAVSRLNLNGSSVNGGRHQTDTEEILAELKRLRWAVIGLTVVLLAVTIVISLR